MHTRKGEEENVKEEARYMDALYYFDLQDRFDELKAKRPYSRYSSQYFNHRTEREEQELSEIGGFLSVFKEALILAKLNMITLTFFDRLYCAKTRYFEYMAFFYIYYISCNVILYIYAMYLTEFLQSC